MPFLYGNTLLVVQRDRLCGSNCIRLSIQSIFRYEGGGEGRYIKILS